MVQAESSYWFLYEGTVGGGIDGNDTVVRSDGTVTDINTGWVDNDGLGSSNGQEWVYFRDSAVDRYIYYVHNTPDNLTDYYRVQNDGGGAMTVFGFGRDDNASQSDLMTAQNNVFTFGFADGGGNFNAASGVINGAYRDVTVALGARTAQSIASVLDFPELTKPDYYPDHEALHDLSSHRVLRFRYPGRQAVRPRYRSRHAKLSARSAGDLSAHRASISSCAIR